MIKDSKKRQIVKQVVSKFKNIDPKQLCKGMEVEKEHSSFNGDKASPATDVVKGSKMNLAKIAVAHLKEDPKYYTHLAAMEKKYSD